ncbi:hypothetical protein E2C01_001488 [Portunus trituberculatus]|uniref:Uncharacterized protein n=1 Tax=Portunus trituberculatus TaxID=210409 RepID=A0A5B7CGS0_PORTR|nr:hypothetical protein [Portunus trituberculatus]
MLSVGRAKLKLVVNIEVSKNGDLHERKETESSAVAVFIITIVVVCSAVRVVVVVGGGSGARCGGSSSGSGRGAVGTPTRWSVLLASPLALSRCLVPEWTRCSHLLALLF